MKCVQCGSVDIVCDVNFMGPGGHRGVMHTLTVGVHRRPDAMIFKNTLFANVTGHICADCGFVMMTVRKIDVRRIKKLKEAEDMERMKDAKSKKQGAK